MWCLKALHPSDPLTDVDGVPDQTAMPTTVLNYQQMDTIVNPSALAGTTWECEITFCPDPSIFCAVRTQGSDGSNVTAYNIFNTNLSASSTGAVAAVLSGAFERWRLAYAGLTCYADGPAMANQGSVVAAQYPARGFQVGGWTLPGAAHTVYTNRFPQVRWQAHDSPGYAGLIGMPNAYTGLAKDGVYMPLKLDSNHAEWHDLNDVVGDASSWVFGLHTSEYVIPALAAPIMPGNFPYYDFHGSYINSANDAFTSSPHLSPLIGTFGQMAFRNLGPEVSLSLATRVGIEAMVQPPSTFMPYVHLSPAYDIAAITNYYRIARELKDAYPADYNDLGKLWDVIKMAASTLSPLLSLIPGGSIIRAAGSVVGKAIDAARSGKRDKPPAATLERAKQVVKAKQVAKAKPKVVARRR